MTLPIIRAIARRRREQRLIRERILGFKPPTAAELNAAVAAAERILRGR